MTNIIWTKCPRSAFWSGAIGQDTYDQRFKFSIRKTKPSSAPHSRFAARARARAGQVWSYDYVLIERINSECHVVGTYPSFEAAKAAATQRL
jgi:hypothetical protein